MTQLKKIRSLLKAQTPPSNEGTAMFFKTGPDSYSAHDRFIGVSVPILRKIAKEFADLSYEDIQSLLESKINEERLLGLIILVTHYQRADDKNKNHIYQFYRDNLQHVNNWNLVDASAHLIIGAQLYEKKRDPLLILAKSQNLWERRIAIVSTWYFIKKDDLAWTFKIAKILLKDEHDLIHKATGWMLREAGKRDESELVTFLEQHAIHMPRTMLRYAIEKFPETRRKKFLLK